LSTREGAVSLFDFPRIHIFGLHRVNPGTGNNNSASPGDELTVTADSERVSAVTLGKTDAEFQRWITQLDPQQLLRCQWNYYGDMSFAFEDVRVRSVQLSHDTALDTQHDALIGASVHLNNAIVCDVNPEGFNSTQIFAEALEIHAPQVFAAAGSFISRQPDRATTRWLNWQRNLSYHGRFGLPPNGVDGELSSGAAGGASASFQCGIEIKPEDLRQVVGDQRDLSQARYQLLLKQPPPNQPSPSPVMAALVAAIHKGARGLVFRYNLHLCCPKLSDTELARSFARAERISNPAYGVVIGTIAPWYDAEPSTITMGRLLRPAAAFENPYRKDKPHYLSPAVARHDPQRKQLSIDLANCLPEDGEAGDKFDLGTVTIGLRAVTAANERPASNTAAFYPIGTLQNDRQTYRDQGGIYDLSYAHLPENGAWLDDGEHELVLHTARFGVLAYEPEYMLMSDTTCSYLDQPPAGRRWDRPARRKRLRAMPHSALRGEVDLWLLRRGKPAPAPVQVTIEEWQVTPTGSVAQYGVYRYPTLLKREVRSMAAARMRYALIPSAGSTAALRMFRFVPECQWTQNISEYELADRSIQESLVELRILPYDDYTQLRAEQLTWQLIYREVLRYYHLITPGMSEALDLSDPAIWELPTAARYVLVTTSLELWPSWQFMPRTRDLSRYRRQLLRRFCRRVLQRQHRER
jgi:hypothetical protein